MARRKIPKTFDEFKALKVVELKQIAKKFGIPRYYDMNEDALITAIMLKKGLVKEKKVSKPAEELKQVDESIPCVLPEESEKPLKSMNEEDFKEIKDSPVLIRDRKVCPTCKKLTLEQVSKDKPREFKCTNCKRNIAFM